MSDFNIGELQRQLANLIRVGKVVELDEANARVKVSASGLTTAWLPWGTGRAGTTRTTSMPTVGEQVMLFSPYGDTAQGVVGFSLYQDDHPAASDSKDKERTIYPDGSVVEYDSASNTLTVTVAAAGKVIINCKEATVNAETSVTLNTPDTFCKGKLTVDGLITGKTGATLTNGSVTHNGKNIGDTHTHIGSPTAPAGPRTPTGAPN